MNYTEISDPDYWRKLNPQLSISEKVGEQSIPHLNMNTDEKTRERLIDEGYIEYDKVIHHETVLLLKEGILSLRRHNWYPVFAFMYDEYWELFFSLKGLLSFVLGSKLQMLPDFWVWYVDPVKEESGWGPHRDKTINSLMSDGMPKSATVWVSLSDSNPLNGCMYLIPANKDSGYRDFISNSLPADFQSARALPVPAGSVLLWNQRVFHWGGRSSKYAAEPRISMAVEFQRGDIPAYNHPLIAMSSIPPFELRLKLIGKQILQYTHMYNYSDELISLAKAMVGNTNPEQNIDASAFKNVKRNDPCPCGSGKKYKLCHGIPI